MKRATAMKILRRISVNWPMFKYITESDETQRAVADDWMDELGMFDEKRVLQVLEKFIDEDGREYAPTAKDFRRLLKAEKKAVESYYVAPPEFRDEVRKGLRERDMVFCSFQNYEDAAPIKDWFQKSDCIWDGERYWPKMEFAMWWLGGNFVTKELRKAFGQLSPKELWACFEKQENREKLDHLKDLLVEVAMEHKKSGSHCWKDLSIAEKVKSNQQIKAESKILEVERKNTPQSAVYPKPTAVSSSGVVLDENFDWNSDFNLLESTKAMERQKENWEPKSGDEL